MIEKKTLTVELEFFRGDSAPAEGYYEEGVPDPDYLEELAVFVDEEEVYDEETDGFTKSGRLQVSFAGSRRSFSELGRYFLAMSEFSALNLSYHDHLGGFRKVEGKKEVELIVRLPRQPATEVD